MSTESALRRYARRARRLPADLRVARGHRAASVRLGAATSSRVLVVDVGVPEHDRYAGGLRMTSILCELRALGCQVTFFPLQQREAREPYTTQLRRLGVEIDHATRSLEDFTAARAGLYDVVILSTPASAGSCIDVAREAFPAARIVYDSVDLHFLRLERQSAVAGGQLHVDFWREREIDAFRRADVVATVTETEAEVVRSLVPEARTLVLPTVHETDPQPRLPRGSTQGLLFIGAFAHAPNTDAIRWFAEEILPLVRAEVDTRLTVIGPDPPPEIRALASDVVEVTGYVPDVAPHFRSARVFVSPLRYGAGMKGKNGQAMAFGLPMVTTTIGAEGMGLLDGEHALVRDGAESFAAAVVELHRDAVLWHRLSRQSLALVANRWGPEAMRDRLRALTQHSS